VAAQGLDDPAGVGEAVEVGPEAVALHHLDRDAGVRGQLLGRARPIHHDDPHREAGLDHGGQDGAGARGQHAETGPARRRVRLDHIATVVHHP
jgi:hypothetical protein